MNAHHPSKLAVAAALAAAIMLAPLASASTGSENPSSPEIAGTCPNCREAPVCHPDHAACKEEPRIIRYTYPSGALTVEGSGIKPSSGLRPDTPVAVRVCCINPYRHSVNVKIDQQTFDELYKAPSQVSSELLPSTQPATDKAATKAMVSPADTVLAAKEMDAKVALLNAEKTLDSANQQLDAASSSLKIATDEMTKFNALDAHDPNRAQAATAESAAQRLLDEWTAKVTEAKGQVAAAKATLAQARAAEAQAQAGLPAQLIDFNDDADRLALVDEFVAAQRARVLQVDDPTRLRGLSLAAAFVTAQAALDPDDPRFSNLPNPLPCSSKDCSPAALIQLRSDLANEVEEDFADLTSGFQKAQAADADTEKTLAQKESAAERDQHAADLCTDRRLHAKLERQAAREKATAAAARKNAKKLVTPEIAGLFAKAQKRHDALTSSRAQRDLQFASAMSVYANVLDPDFGCLLFGPVAATGDEIEITIETPLAADAANFTLSPAPEKTATGGGAGSKKPAPAAAPSSQAALIIPVVGNHRPSFSTGIFFTGLVNPTFFRDSNGFVRQHEDSFTPALGAMVHTPLWFPCPDYSFQLSLGVALKDSNPLYLLGPSVIIGRHQRTVITAALAGGQVSRLSNGIRPGDMVPATTQLTTDKVFRYGFLLGLTYNFGAATQSNNNSTSSKGSAK